MVKVNLSGCASFVKDADFKNYVQKALLAWDVLDSESGAGNDFLGWKTLPDGTPESLLEEFEAVRDDWKARGVNLVVVIGIGTVTTGTSEQVHVTAHIDKSELRGNVFFLFKLQIHIHPYLMITLLPLWK